MSAIFRAVARLCQKSFHFYRKQGSTQKSLTDADSRLMLANGKMDVCLNVQTAVDSKHKMVAAFDVINQVQDKNQMKPLAHQASQTLEMDGFLVVADAGYDSATDIAECLLSGFTPHVAGTEIDICVPTDKAGTQEITSPFALWGNYCIPVITNTKNRSPCFIIPKPVPTARKNVRRIGLGDLK